MLWWASAAWGAECDPAKVAQAAQKMRDIAVSYDAVAQATQGLSEACAGPSLGEVARLVASLQVVEASDPTLAQRLALDLGYAREAPERWRELCPRGQDLPARLAAMPPAQAREAVYDTCALEGRFPLDRGTFASSRGLVVLPLAASAALSRSGAAEADITTFVRGLAALPIHEGPFPRPAGPADDGAVKMTATATGGLTDALVTETLARYRNQIKYCYIRELKQSQPQGEVVWTLAVSSEGAVASVQRGSDTMGSEPVAACVEGRLKRVLFPATAPATVRLSFGFTLL
jgi:hypothetical protein